MFAARELDGAKAHNLAIAGQLLGAKNACGAEQRQASGDDPFEVSDLRIVAAIPSVGNLTSDCANASLLWSWSAAYPDAANFEIAPQGSCPPGQLEIYLPAQPHLRNASLSYAYCGKETHVDLAGDGPNPVALRLGQGGCRENSSGLQLPLQARISGEIWISYQYRKSEYGERCSYFGDYEACGCELETEFGTRQYAKKVGGGRNFSVESGTVEPLWISPPLQKRLDGKQEGQVAIFTRRMPYKVSVAWKGEEIAWGLPYKFNVSEGECGQQEVSAQHLPEGRGLALNISQGALDVRQLASTSLAYLPLWAEFPWQAQPGAGEASLGFEGWFCGRQDFARNFSARAPLPFQSDAALLQVREGGEGETPAASSPRAQPIRLAGMGAGAGSLILAAALLAAQHLVPDRCGWK